MIGVLVPENVKPVAEEFFELFKTPWEFARPDRRYSVLLATGGGEVPAGERLTILSGTIPFSVMGRDIATGQLLSETLYHTDEGLLPIHTVTVDVPGSGEALVTTSLGTVAGRRLKSSSGSTVLRLGYDLFQEVDFLLNSGQDPDYAEIPALDRHVALIRSWIVSADISLLEIPPAPSGYSFTCCLSHDVDFLGIRRHLFDRTMFGFLLRAVVPRSFRGAGSIGWWKRWVRNLVAAATLPLVYIGLLRDYWDQVNKYLEMEKDLPATWFFIPHRMKPGKKAPEGFRLIIPLARRAARYSLEQAREHIQKIRDMGCEVGVHGLDAWHDAESSLEELKSIEEVQGKCGAGIRMHWLFFSEETPAILEKAGYLYDSTLGFNDAVGFRSGTSQVHRFPGHSDLDEIPLQVQDGAMLYPRRLGLTEEGALEHVAGVVDTVQAYGGVFTVNWHQRSLGPERNWDHLYRRLLDLVKNRAPWFATMGDAVSWYQFRRSVTFSWDETSGSVRLASSGRPPGLPSLTVRITEAGSGSTVRCEPRSYEWDGNEEAYRL